MTMAASPDNSKRSLILPSGPELSPEPYHMTVCLSVYSTDNVFLINLILQKRKSTTMSSPEPKPIIENKELAQNLELEIP